MSAISETNGLRVIQFKFAFGFGVSVWTLQIEEGQISRLSKNFGFYAIILI